MEQLAVLRAERRQVAAGAPQSPSLAALDSRIVAFEQQIREERAKVAGEGALWRRLSEITRSLC